jgi:hypothetical protein
MHHMLANLSATGQRDSVLTPDPGGTAPGQVTKPAPMSLFWIYSSFLYLVLSSWPMGTYVGIMSCVYHTIPEKNQLKGGRFVLAHGFRGVIHGHWLPCFWAVVGRA